MSTFVDSQYGISREIWKPAGRLRAHLVRIQRAPPTRVPDLSPQHDAGWLLDPLQCRWQLFTAGDEPPPSDRHAVRKLILSRTATTNALLSRPATISDELDPPRNTNAMQTSLKRARGSSKTAAAPASADAVAPSAGTQACAGPGKKPRRGEIVVVNDRPYLFAELRCREMPLSRTTSQAGKGADAGAEKSPVVRRVRVPWDQELPLLSTTFDDLARQGISTISRPYVFTQLERARRKALDDIPEKADYTMADGVSKRLEKPAGEISRAGFCGALSKHQVEQAWTPAYRSGDLTLVGDQIGGNVYDLAPPIAPPSLPRMAAVKDGKSAEASPTKSEQTKPAVPWSQETKYRVGDRSLIAPSWLGKNFFHHITREGRIESGRAHGHVRVTHDRNAFPRTWSLEKIGRAAAQVLDTARQSTEQMGRAIHDRAPFCAPFDGLNVYVFVRDAALKRQAASDAQPAEHAEDPPTGPNFENSIVTAYISFATPAREKENENLKAAVALMGTFENERAKKIAQYANPKNIWHTLGAAQALYQARGKLDLTDAEKGTVEKLRVLLSLGETRHSLHQNRITQDAENTLCATEPKKASSEAETGALAQKSERLNRNH